MDIKVSANNIKFCFITRCQTYMTLTKSLMPGELHIISITGFAFYLLYPPVGTIA